MFDKMRIPHSEKRMQEKKTANFWIQFLDKKFSHNPDSLVFQNYERMCLMNGVVFLHI